jgi:hypothetical protein
MKYKNSVFSVFLVIALVSGVFLVTSDSYKIEAG